MGKISSKEVKLEVKRREFDSLLVHLVQAPDLTALKKTAKQARRFLDYFGRSLPQGEYQVYHEKYAQAYQNSKAFGTK